MAVAPILQVVPGALQQGTARTTAPGAGLNAPLDAGLYERLTTGLGTEADPAQSIAEAELSAGGSSGFAGLAPSDRWQAILSMAGVNRETSIASRPSNRAPASALPAAASRAGAPPGGAPIWPPMAVPSAQTPGNPNAPRPALSCAKAADGPGEKAEKSLPGARVRREKKLSREASPTALCTVPSLHAVLAQQAAPFQPMPLPPAGGGRSAGSVAYAGATSFSRAPVIGPVGLPAPAASLSAVASGPPAELPSAAPAHLAVFGAVPSPVPAAAHTAQVTGMGAEIESSTGKEMVSPSQPSADSLHVPGPAAALAEASLAPSSAPVAPHLATSSFEKAVQPAASPSGSGKITAETSAPRVGDAALTPGGAQAKTGLATRPSASAHHSRQIRQEAASHNAVTGNQVPHAAGSAEAGAAPVPFGPGPGPGSVQDSRQSAAERAATPGSMQTAFSAMDGAAPDGAAWVHASARHAEAGFQDASLGWVSVRAEASGAGVHATLAGGSAEAAQSLSGHVAGLRTFLEERQTPVQSIHVMQPGLGTMGGGTSNGGHHGPHQQNTGQNDSAAGAVGTHNSLSRTGQVAMSVAAADLSSPAGSSAEGHVSWIA